MAGESDAARIHLADAGVEELPEDWDVIELGSILSEDRGVSVGVMYPGEHVVDGVPLIKAGDLNGSIINPRPDFRISREKHHEYRRTELEGGELIMTLVGNVGQCAVVPPGMAGWNTARAVAVMRLRDPSEAHFVQQCLLSRPLQHLMDVWCNTTVQATLNLKEIRQLPLPWPPKPHRDAIASLGKALDDKIELNRRMNATLEAMARALFQSWFVDFDPVRAKLDGRKPEALDKPTAALFPAAFQDSPLGPIPRGWTVDTIKNRASTIQYGFTQSATDEPIGPRFLRITDIRGGTIDWSSVPFCQATEEEQEKYRITDGDIFIARTGASTGDNIYVIEPPAAVFASYLVRVQFASRGVGRLVGEFTRTPDYANHVAGSIGGSAQPNASAQTLVAASLVFPTEEIADAFYRTVRPLDSRRAANDRESRTLATLRDTLLPRLLSGELAVPPALGKVKS